MLANAAAMLLAAAVSFPPFPHSGKGLDLVRMFYSLLPQRHRWVEAQGQAAEFIIDETFGVPGVGTVVAGASRQGHAHTCPAQQCLVTEASS
jgi:GTPase